MQKQSNQENQSEAKLGTVKVEAQVKSGSDVKIKRFRELTEEEVRLVAGGLLKRNSP